MQTKNILIAPLNWGLGHATRCIPVVKALITQGFVPIIACDGMALELLKKEFPSLLFLNLPSYGIEYAQKGKNLKWKLFKKIPKLIKVICQEKKIIKEWIKVYSLRGIISDNRFGVFSNKIPSVYITHQLNIFSGKTTKLTSKIHQKHLLKYTECWVPDFEETPNLSGNLGHLTVFNSKIKYIGALSRFLKKNMPIKYDLLIVLSGPEPQRSLLEKKLKEEICNFKGNIVFIQGIVEKEVVEIKNNNVTYYNFATSFQLEMLYNQSDLVLCRSGYTTIMDLAKLEKKAFFIPTPGQYEQEYLAKKLASEQIAPFAIQDEFKIENLNCVNNYKGLKSFNDDINWIKMFQVFME